MAPPLPEIRISQSLRDAIDGAASAHASIDAAEQRAHAVDIPVSLARDDEWRRLHRAVAELVRERGYVVLRGLRPDEGRTLLLVGALLGDSYGTYGRQRIVKRFRMSPWTRGLSHTLAAGNFHTDGNVSDVPPIATAMQCEREDPGGDDYAELRVAHLPALLRHLSRSGEDGADASAFLLEEEVPMAHETSPRQWCGRLVQNGSIRYHPESLRVANVRGARDPDRIERVIATIHRSALAVSHPFHTRAGDILLVSNNQALHYRGACSVRFTRFPTEFEARSLLVLHRMPADG